MLGDRVDSSHYRSIKVIALLPFNLQATALKESGAVDFPSYRGDRPAGERESGSRGWHNTDICTRGDNSSFLSIIYRRDTTPAQQPISHPVIQIFSYSRIAASTIAKHAHKVARSQTHEVDQFHTAPRYPVHIPRSAWSAVPHPRTSIPVETCTTQAQCK